ncbi:hypothetical protein Ciccas_011851, partial [Cichlidogyrus casuarinus]
ISEFYGLRSCMPLAMANLHSPRPGLDGASIFSSILGHVPCPASGSSSEFYVQEMSRDRLMICRGNGKGKAPISPIVHAPTDSNLVMHQLSTSSSSSAPMRGILKQRTLSESSCVVFSEERVEELGSCDGLLRQITQGAATGLIHSNSFSSISNDESDVDPVYPPGLCVTPRRRVHSICVDGLPSTSSTSSMTGTRQRIRSVNFSKKDDSMNFCPQDSVDAFHHSVMNRKKKAKKNERRRYHSLSELPSDTAVSESQNNPRKKRKQKKGKKLSFPNEPAEQQQQKQLEENKDQVPTLTADVIFELDES